MRNGESMGTLNTQGEDVSEQPLDQTEGVEPGIWRYAMAERVSVIVDAADYFAMMQQAMLKARHRIFMIGWDFDTRIHLAAGRRWFEKGRRRTYPSRLGSFFVWLIRKRPGLEIRILKWSFGVFKFVVRSSMWMDLVRWWPHRRIDFKFDNAHPLGCSHHQKIVLLDNRLAACGGIDMTVSRWDDREHLPEHENRRTPGGKPYGPWHDMTMMMEGDVARSLAELGQERWRRAGGKPLPAVPARDDSLWPEGLSVQFENVEIGISRTVAPHRDWDEVREIEQLFKDHVRRAKRFIYAESQYFASRVIAEAVVARLEEDDPPEFVIVHPANADGWLEQQAMDHARAELVRTIDAVDRKERFSLWMPFTHETAIYVHAKVMIVDDEVLRIGSANMNNRSLGLDSECDISIDCRRAANSACGPAIRQLRVSLLAEHCGLAEAETARLLDEAGSMRRFIEQNGQRPGERRTLQRYRPPELNALQSTVAQAAILDPETPTGMLEPFKQEGLFPPNSRLGRIHNRLRRKK